MLSKANGAYEVSGVGWFLPSVWVEIRHRNFHVQFFVTLFIHNCSVDVAMLLRVGQRLIDFILSPVGKKVKGLEDISNEDQAVELCHKLLNLQPA